MDYSIKKCLKHTDSRGYLVEFLQCAELAPNIKTFGQIYFVTFEKPRQVRGNHYHTKFYEWFGVASGILEVVLEDVRTKERVEMVLDSNDKSFVRLTIGPYIAHAFRNLSPTAVLLDYCNEMYSTGSPDRNTHILIPPDK